MHGFLTESRSFRQPVTPTSPLFLAFTHGEDKDLLELERQRAADALNLSLSCTLHHFFFFLNQRIWAPSVKKRTWASR